MSRVGLLIVAVLSFVAASTARAQTDGEFRVCADPDNLPFSNEAMQGFENRLADLVAKDFDATPSYVWWGQRRGFIRNTMNATLKEGRCEVVIGVPDKYDLVLTTKPYYRSTYVFVYRRDDGPAVKSLDDPALKTLRIGVHLLGENSGNGPPAHELAKRGIVGNVTSFSTFYSAENPPSAIIDAVAAGRIDVAIVWGPIAGYFARRQTRALDLVPVPSGAGDLPFAFDIAMGVRRGNDSLRDRLQAVIDRRAEEIAGILKDFGVPIVATRGAATP
jgi:quinoprotein dehydrogenase-associated probable ABC transporter substrate-binding protein